MTTTHLVTAACLLFLTLVLVMIVPRAASDAMHRAPLNIRHITAWMIAVAIAVTGGVASLQILHLVQVPTLLVALWGVGLPVFLGAMLSPLASGFLLVWSPPFRIGERVLIQMPYGEVGGVVADMDIHFTHIADGGQIKLVPNALIAASVITRPTHGEIVSGATHA